MEKIQNKYLIATCSILLTTVMMLVFCSAHFIRPLLITKKKNNSDCLIAYIPRAAYCSLIFIKKFHRAPTDYKPITTFKHRDNNPIPINDENGKIISYIESDIYPMINGISRGKERLVLGSDGRSYYTYDHYQHFIEITNECETRFHRKARFL